MVGIIITGCNYFFAIRLTILIIGECANVICIIPVGKNGIAIYIPNISFKRERGVTFTSRRSLSVYNISGKLITVPAVISIMRKYFFHRYKAGCSFFEYVSINFS